MQNIGIKVKLIQIINRIYIILSIIMFITNVRKILGVHNSKKS